MDVTFNPSQMRGPLYVQSEMEITFRDPCILICTATRKYMAKTVADKVQWAGAESELQFSPSELLQGHYECENLFMQVDVGTKFFIEFSSSGEPNYLH